MHHSACVASAGLAKYEPAVTYKIFCWNRLKGVAKYGFVAFLVEGGGVSHFQFTNIADSEFLRILKYLLLGCEITCQTGEVVWAKA